jgi:uncharacterized phiE125 gp8 family phage protein
MPSYSIKTLTAPGMEPVTVSNAKAQMRLTIPADDSLVALLITACREHAENLTRRAFVDQVIQVTYDGFPKLGKRIELPRPPLTAVNSITYLDLNGVQQTLDPSQYIVHNDSDLMPAYITPPANTSTWPDTLNEVGGFGCVQINCEVGWPIVNGAPSTPLPIQQWIMVRVATLYEQREGLYFAPGVAPAIPYAFIDGLLDKYRVPEVA